MQNGNQSCNEVFEDILCDLVAKKKETSKISDASIASAIGISKSALSKYKNGKVEIGPYSLVAIAKYFGVSTDYLLGLYPDPAVEKSMRVACETTGLSSAAIKSVSSLSPFSREILNELLTSSELQQTLYSLYSTAGVKKIYDVLKGQIGDGQYTSPAEIALSKDAAPQLKVESFNGYMQLKQLFDDTVNRLSKRKDIEEFGENGAEQYAKKYEFPKK